MKIKTMFISSIIMLLLIPVIDSKPVIIGFTEEIDQNVIKKNTVLPITHNIVILTLFQPIFQKVYLKS